MKRILISDELAAILAATDKDATAAIGKLSQSYVFAGAAYVTANGASDALVAAVQKVPPAQLKQFMNIAELMLNDILKADAVEVKET